MPFPTFEKQSFTQSFFPIFSIKISEVAVSEADLKC